MPPLSPDAYLEHLRAASTRFSVALSDGDPAAPVRTCGDWRMRDLAEHLGGVQRWATTAVLEGHPNGTADDPPPDHEGLVTWFDDGAAALATTLREAGPEAPCWSFGPKPRTAAFWFRRQALEATMHAYDAQITTAATTGATAGAPTAVAADLAQDGIDEALTMFLPRQVRLGRTVLPDVRVAVAVDEGPAWEIAGPDAPEGPAATLRGSAEGLLLLVWGRVGVDDARVRVEGEHSAVDAVLAAGVTP